MAQGGSEAVQGVSAWVAITGMTVIVSASESALVLRLQ